MLVLTACPQGLRGQLTRWLLEISPGVYVGKPSARVKELLWQQTVSMVKGGRAIMVESANNEQGLTFRVHGHEWTPVDFDGLTLIRRPADTVTRTPVGWSNAAKRRRGKQFRR